MFYFEHPTQLLNKFIIMKKIYLFFAVSFFLTTAFGQFSGNGKTGFGGAVGQGSLTLSDDGTTLTLTLTKGSGPLNDAVVIYIDSRTGGFSSTANFTDEGDGLRKAISGLDGSNRSLLTFPTGFQPDYAIAFDKGFGGVWELKENGPHTYITSANLPPSTENSPNFVLTVNNSDISLPSGTVTFKFLVTYTSETAYRSNEFIGDAGPADNPGFAPYTATESQEFNSALPVTFTGVTARNTGGKNVISWSVANQVNADHYEIFTSANGQTFSPEAKIVAGSAASAQYSYTDANPVNGMNYYRVAMVEKNGKTYQSDVVSVNNAFGNGLKVFVSGGNLVLQMNGQDKGHYRLALVNSSGQPVYQQNLNYDGSNQVLQIKLDSRLSAGIYSVILNSESERNTQQILIK